MKMRWSLSLGLMLAGPLAAQSPSDTAATETIPARMDWFPYLLGDPTHGLLIIGHWQIARQSEYTARFAHDWILATEAAWGTRGSRMVTAKFRAPNLIPSWRFSGDAGAVREGRFGYYGVGAGGDAGLDPESQPTDYFRVHRTQYYGRGEVTRHLKGPLSVAVGAGLTSYRYRALEDESLFRSDHPDGLTGTDATVRFTVVFDSRTNELLPANGLLLEAGVYGGTGRFCDAPCGSGYLGLYAHGRGFLSPRRGLVFAGRVGYRTLGENAPLDARYDFPGWERELSVYGGFDSNRGSPRGRLVGRRVLMTSAEVRYDLVDGGDYGALTVLAFMDGGGVYDAAPDGAMTFSGWKTGFGAGIALRVLRQAIVSFNFAKGPEGFNFTSGTGWSF
jgi:outer membrane protein assembly factor BamA